MTMAARFVHFSVQIIEFTYGDEKLSGSPVYDLC